MYSPDKPYPVYDQAYWWGDTWSAIDYGREFDFSRPFFEQFHELQLVVPRLSLFNYQSENSYYSNHALGNKNCYMVVDLGGCEDVYHSNWMTNCKNCLDCSYTHDSQLSYFCLYDKNLFNCDFCFECENVADSMFCFDCRQCSNCFGCAGLRKRQYCIFNRQVSKEEYEKFVESRRYSYIAQQESLQQFVDLVKTVPHRYAHIVHSEDCSGNYIINCKNARNCFDVMNMQDVKYCYNALDIKDGYDAYQTGYGASELTYETHAGNTIFNGRFLHLCRAVTNCDYCDSCFESSDLFGCVGIRKGRFCLLNKQYKEGEFSKLRSAVVSHMKKTGEWGEFFPFWCSPFGYNESKAQEYYPLSREEALKRGMQWSDYAPPVPSGSTIDSPDDIRTVDDVIVERVLKCDETGVLFKITAQELAFLRKKKLPIPRLSPQRRYEKRMAFRNPRTLFTRNCSKCSAEIQTTYAPDRLEKVFCERCYLGATY